MGHVQDQYIDNFCNDNALAANIIGTAIINVKSEADL